MVGSQVWDQVTLAGFADPDATEFLEQSMELHIVHKILKTDDSKMCTLGTSKRTLFQCPQKFHSPQLPGLKKMIEPQSEDECFPSELGLVSVFEETQILLQGGERHLILLPSKHVSMGA
jgi:hypothetical protein